MNIEESLLSVIAQIYEAVGRPELWEATLVSINDLLQGTAGNLLCHDHRNHNGTIYASTIDPAANEAYSLHFHALDPWAGSIRAGTFVPEEIILRQSVLPYRMVGTEFYSDFGRKLGLTCAIVGVEASPDGASSVIRVNRPDAGAEFDPEAGRILSVVVPHLRRALNLHRRLMSVDSERKALIEILDRFRTAVVLFDTELHTVAMNQAASVLASVGDGFTIEKRQVRCAMPGVTSHLTRVLGSAAAIASGAALEARGSSLTLPRPSGRPSLLASVVPLSKAPVGAPAVVLFIHDPADMAMLPARLLAEKYGLTPAESRVARALAQGQSVKEISERFTLTQATARW